MPSLPNHLRSFLERAMDPKERDRETYFQIAADLCKGEPEKTACVNSALGDFYFEVEEYGQAARVYSTTTKSFEEIVIKFIKNNKMDELLGFLLYRLKFMESRIQTRLQERSQLCCLCTWVTQLYLVQLNDAMGDEEKYEEVQYEFHTFIEYYLDLNFLDKSTICDLLASLANPEELLYFVELLKDYRRVIAQHVTHGEYESAMSILTEHCFSEQYDELWYQFSPRLIQHAPVALVTGWMRVEHGKRPFLKPPRLIPALIKYHVKYNPPGVTKNQAIRYLQWLVDDQGNKDKAIHNMLLSLYAKQNDDTDLLRFLQEHMDNPIYDLKYALRLCLTEEKHRACVHIYSALQLYEDAVRFALATGDTKLAKMVAEESDEDDANKKRFWMCIVQHIVKNHRNGVKEVIDMLRDRECRVLELEDILPYFPDFVYIQDFKDEICESLGGYNKKLDILKKGMDEVTRSAEGIKEDISDLKNDYFYVREQDSCIECSHLVLARDFCVFSACGHIFHEKCLLAKVKKYLDEDSSDDGLRMMKSIRQLEDRMRDTESESRQRSIHSELQGFLSNDCPYCGDMQINEIGQPFISERDKLREVGSWRLDGDY